MNDDESTDEYNEHYNCYEYTSFESMHYFELSRQLRSSEKTQYSSTANDFNPLSFLFSNMKNSLLGTPKMIKEQDDTSRLRSNASVSSESSEEDESLSEEYEKIQTLNNDSNDFLFSLSLDRARFNNHHSDSARMNLETPISQLPPMRNSKSDNTNLKSVTNERLAANSLTNFSLSQLNRRFSLNYTGQEELLKKEFKSY